MFFREEVNALESKLYTSCPNCSGSNPREEEESCSRDSSLERSCSLDSLGGMGARLQGVSTSLQNVKVHNLNHADHICFVPIQ